MSTEDALLIAGIFGYLSLFAQGLVLGFAAIFFLNKFSGKNKFVKSAASVLAENALVLAFFVSLFAAAGSLFLSDIARIAPCKLCWYQRAFMYPQVIILGLAAIKSDFAVKKYILGLSFVGVAIAVYHYLIQMSPLPLPCTDEIVDCASTQLVYFGYITIPLMSLTAFAIIIFLMLFAKNKK